MWLWHNSREKIKEVADILLLFVSFLTFVKSSNDIRHMSGEITDLSFDEETFVAGRSVTCDPFNNDPKTPYPAKTWTCKNMKIDGERLRYWVVPSISQQLHCGVKMEEWSGRNEFGALCRKLLKKHLIEDKLWAATISEASCDDSENPRVLFVKTGHRDDLDNGYNWEQFPPGRGIVISFQCTILS